MEGCARTYFVYQTPKINSCSERSSSIVATDIVDGKFFVERLAILIVSLWGGSVKFSKSNFMRRITVVLKQYICWPCIERQPQCLFVAHCCMWIGDRFYLKTLNISETTRRVKKVGNEIISSRKRISNDTKLGCPHTWGLRGGKIKYWNEYPQNKYHTTFRGDVTAFIL